MGSSAFGQAAGALPVPAPILQPGDAVRVDVWERPQLSGQFLVGADSAISHPYYQEVKVAYLPLDVVVTRVRSFLQASETNPRVRVEPLLRISIGGEVRQPNLYTLGPETTIAQAVALAGGPTQLGRLDRVHLVRNGTESVVDLTSATEPLAQMPIRSGDQIMIGRKQAVFREYVMPVFAMIGSTAAIINVLLRYR